MDTSYSRNLHTTPLLSPKKLRRQFEEYTICGFLYHRNLGEYFPLGCEYRSFVEQEAIASLENPFEDGSFRSIYLAEYLPKKRKPQLIGLEAFIGYDSSHIYAIQSDWLGVVLAQISRDGVKITDHSHDSIIPYSQAFSVFEKHVRTDTINCRYYPHYTNSVIFNGQVIDTFHTIKEKEEHPWVNIRNDTFIYRDDYHIRQYVKDELLGKWDIQDWNGSLKVLPITTRSTFLSEDGILFVTVNFDADNSTGLKEVEGKVYTLNDIPLKEKATVYSVVLAFDFYKERFLGYPKVFFDARD